MGKMTEEVLQPLMEFSALPNVSTAWYIADNALVAMNYPAAKSRHQEHDLLTRVLVHLIYPEKS